VDELWKVLRDPKVSTLGVLALLVLGGVGVGLLGYQGVAAQFYAVTQLPYLISGTFVGIALVGTGLRLLAIHLDRVEAATEREQLAGVQREVLRLLAARREGRTPTA
jgi:hypothetical protein